MEKIFARYYVKRRRILTVLVVLGLIPLIASFIVTDNVGVWVLRAASAFLLWPIPWVLFVHSVLWVMSRKYHLSKAYYPVMDKAVDDRLYALNRTFRNGRAGEVEDAGKDESIEFLRAARGFIRTGGTIETLKEKVKRICTNHLVDVDLFVGPTDYFDEILEIWWEGVEKKEVRKSINVIR